MSEWKDPAGDLRRAYENSRANFYSASEVKRTPDFRHLLISDITIYLAEKFDISYGAAHAHAEKLVDYVDEISKNLVGEVR